MQLNKKVPDLIILAEYCGVDTVDDEVYPLQFKLIQTEQQKVKQLLEKAKTSSANYKTKDFLGGRKKCQLISLNDKIVVPKSLQSKIVIWCNVNLSHPGQIRTEATIRQHFTRNNLRKDVEQVCKKCHNHQLTKKIDPKIGLLPAKNVEEGPWDTLCVDLIGPCMIERKRKCKKEKKKKDLTQWCVTMIDPVTSWFEIAEMKTQRADIIANIVETTWLTRYPYPTQ
eukprot:6079218-Ditylum_brightwellii.AAC.1